MEILEQDWFNSFSPIVSSGEQFFRNTLKSRSYNRNADIYRKLTNTDYIPITCLFKDNSYSITPMQREILNALQINNMFFEDFMGMALDKLSNKSILSGSDSIKALGGNMIVIEKLFNDWKELKEDTSNLFFRFNPDYSSGASIRAGSNNAGIINLISNVLKFGNNIQNTKASFSNYSAPFNKCKLLNYNNHTLGFSMQSAILWNNGLSEGTNRALGHLHYIFLTAAIRKSSLPLLSTQDLSTITKDQLIDSIVLMIDRRAFDMAIGKATALAKIFNTIFNVYYENDYEIIIVDNLYDYLLGVDYNKDIIQKGKPLLTQYLNNVIFTKENAEIFIGAGTELTI